AFLNAGQPHVAELIYLRLRLFVLSYFKDMKYPVCRDKMTSRRERRVYISTKHTLPLRERYLEDELVKRRMQTLDLIPSDGDKQTLYCELVQSMTMNPTTYAVMLIPQHGTLRLFISYHCHYTGRMSDIAYYLREMEVFGIMPSYGTYVDLLHGFF